MQSQAGAFGAGGDSVRPEQWVGACVGQGKRTAQLDDAMLLCDSVRIKPARINPEVLAGLRGAAGAYFRGFAVSVRDHTGS